MPYKPVLYDIAADMRENVTTLCKSMAENKGIELITDLPDAALVTGDINMLQTVVRNLLDNAIKFTSKGGTVTLEIEDRKSVRAQDRKSLLPQTANRSPHTAHRISISDTGTGMSEEQISHLLHKGNDGTGRKSSTPTRGTANETGTGLGLVVCKELLEKHNTTLHIESEEGKGSTFWFEI
jgi:signal transduction histidine kinase